MKKIILLLVLTMSFSFIGCEKQELFENEGMPPHVKEMLGITKSKMMDPQEPMCTGIGSDGWSYVVYESGGLYYSGRWTSNENYTEQFIGWSITEANNICTSNEDGAWQIGKANPEDSLVEINSLQSVIDPIYDHPGHIEGMTECTVNCDPNGGSSGTCTEQFLPAPIWYTHIDCPVH